jgi:hypothetical protein
MPVLASVIGVDRSSGVSEAAWARLALAALLVGWLGSPEGLVPAARAEPLTLEGLTFSDELGGVEIKQGWGTGTLDDPFVLVEEITEYEPAILVIRGMTHRFGNRIRSHHEVGFALTKIVLNRTEQTWTQFDLELREFIDQASPFGDGLSFGQATEAGHPFSADSFAENIETREPYDGVTFFGGAVAPGETVVLSVVVTDTTPRWQFYLLQKRDSPLAALPDLPGQPRPPVVAPAVSALRLPEPAVPEWVVMAGG